ncbi:MAG: DUF2799 domain-containing protein [Pseudomonadota bacterium]
MKQPILSLFFVAALGLGGCATEIMSEQECLEGAWYAAGRDDGAAGLQASQFGARAERCAQFGVVPDEAAYLSGRETALYSLCTDAGGYAYGRRGDDYRGVCKPEVEDAFLDGYISGRWVFAAEADRNAAQEAYDRSLSRIESYRSQIRAARQRLDDDRLTDDERDDILSELDVSRDLMRNEQEDADDALYGLGRADEALTRAEDEARDWRRRPFLGSAKKRIAAVHHFARAENGIDYCTDKSRDFSVLCILQGGSPLIDAASGAACAVGPGEARLLGSSFGETVELLVFEVFPLNTRTGRLARRPTNSFEARFDDEGAYLGVSCAAPVQ